MKVILDEMLPAGVAGLLPGHQVTTVKQAGYTGCPVTAQAARIQDAVTNARPGTVTRLGLG
ncbi:MAG: hypothetical protein V4515_06965 [Chloroflexota bacterium]